jgi:CubicO group peptidase (beta-lactamase class C family)
MTRWFFSSALALALFSPSLRADDVDDFIRNEMTGRQIPGLAIAVLENGKLCRSGAYGLANLEHNVPVKPETVFEVGSVTKQFTAAGILLLAQDGKLSLDDPVRRHLKDAPDSWQEVRVRHLLTHTSGIKSYTGLDGFELRRHLTQAQFITTLAALPLEFRPGDSWKYSNSGYSLLGYIIENVSGKSYWDFMFQRVFGPLKMYATTNRNPTVILPNRAVGYEHTNHILINRDYDLTDVCAAGALVSNIGDLAKWNAALDTDAIFSPAIKQQMWTPARLNDGKLTRYGLGWFIDSVENRRIIGHGGSTSGFSATIQRFPDEHLAIIILTNTDEELATNLARKLAARFFCKR